MLRERMMGPANRTEGGNQPPAGQNRQQVLVEIAVPKNQSRSFAFAMAARFSLPSFELDTSFTPVSVSPHPDHAPTLDLTDQQVVLVRGTISADQIETLRAQPGVLAVHPDVPIAPFRPVLVKATEGLDLVPTEAFGDCAIPPCDCSPTIAKGTIGDVAAYLGVDRIWAGGFRGEGMAIGIVDGGITT